MLIDCVKVVGGNALFCTELHWYLHGIMDTDSFYISISGDCLEVSFKDDTALDDDGWVAMVEFRAECNKYLISTQRDKAQMVCLNWSGKAIGWCVWRANRMLLVMAL